MMEKDSKDSKDSDVLFDLLLMTRRLEEEGFHCVLYVQRKGKPLIVQSHREEQTLLSAASAILAEQMRQQGRS